MGVLLSVLKTEVDQEFNKKGTQKLLLQFFKSKYTIAAEFRILDVSVCQGLYICTQA